MVRKPNGATGVFAEKGRATAVADAVAPPLLPICQLLPGSGQKSDPYASQSKWSEQGIGEHVEFPPNHSKDDSGSGHSGAP